jgi:hypothetical protein
MPSGQSPADTYFASAATVSGQAQNCARCDLSFSVGLSRALVTADDLQTVPGMPRERAGRCPPTAYGSALDGMLPKQSQAKLASARG